MMRRFFYTLALLWACASLSAGALEDFQSQSLPGLMPHFVGAAMQADTLRLSPGDSYLRAGKGLRNRLASKAMAAWKRHLPGATRMVVGNSLQGDLWQTDERGGLQAVQSWGAGTAAVAAPSGRVFTTYSGSLRAGGQGLDLLYAQTLGAYLLADRLDFFVNFGMPLQGSSLGLLLGGGARVHLPLGGPLRINVGGQADYNMAMDFGADTVSSGFGFSGLAGIEIRLSQRSSLDLTAKAGQNSTALYFGITQGF